MKNLSILFLALFSVSFLTAQNVGVNTPNPEVSLHVTGDDNNGRTAAVKIETSSGQNMLLDGNEIDVFGTDSLLYLQNNSGGNILMTRGGGSIGIGALESIATMNIRSKTNQLIGLRVEDPNGNPDFQVSNLGRVGINQWWRNATLNVRAGKGGGGNTGGVFRVEDTTGGILFYVTETGSVAVTGNISKGGGSFKIDHPLDPANQYLYHSFVESPDMMNVYNGNISTDANGFATVTLPDYFETLNRDFRYQLTVIGTFAQAIIKEKVEGNAFVIQTSEPNVEVSWQVTGIRQDPYANKNRIPNAVEKADKNKGKYLHPEAYGQPKDKQIGLIKE